MKGKGCNVDMAEEGFVGNDVIFLTNNNITLRLFDWLKCRESVHLISEPLMLDRVYEINPMWIISYNYIHIITDDILEYMNGRVINLHISYLPWNRGSSPNIWSFIDATPKGVTIHQVSSGLDKGDILYQKECYFDETKETFSSTYVKLNEAIMQLFMEKWEDIKAGNYILKEQLGTGSYHSNKRLEDLRERLPFDWDENIENFLRRYKSLEE